MKVVKAARPNIRAQDFVVLIAEKIDTEWQIVKRGGKYIKGLFVGIKENEEHQEEETEMYIEQPTFDTTSSAQSVKEHVDKRASLQEHLHIY